MTLEGRIDRRSPTPRQRLLTAGLALLLCKSAAIAGAAATTEPLVELRSTVPGELPEPHLTVFGVRVGEDDLSAVAGRLGDAVAFAPGGSGELAALCYVGMDAKENVAVIFQSPRFHPGRIVTSAHVTTRAALKEDARRCAMSPALASQATGSHLTLGMDIADFQAGFAALPSEQGERVLGYYFFRRLGPGSQPRGEHSRCQLLSGIRGRFERSQLRSLTVYRLHRGAGC